MITGDSESGESELGSENDLLDGDYQQNYVHDLDEDALNRAAGALDDVYGAGEHDWEFVHSLEEDDRLSRYGLEPGSALVYELHHIIGYCVLLRVSGQAGATLGLRTRDGAEPSYPPRVDKKSGEVIELWASLAGTAQHPRTLARLEDLLFTARHGRVGEHANAAIDNYKHVCQLSAEPGLGATTALARGWELARLVNSSEREADLRRQALIWAEQEAKSGAIRYGVWLPLMAVAASPPRSTTVEQARTLDPEFEDRFDALLESGMTQVDEGRFASELTELAKSRLGPGQDLSELREREVAAYLRVARSASGFVKQAKLEEAIAQARRYGFHDHAAQITAELQNIPRSELQMARFRAPIEVPLSEVERYLSSYTAGADWRYAFEHFLSTPPPTGDVDTLQTRARELLQASPLRAMLRTKMLNSSRLPIWVAKDDNESEQHEMSYLAQIEASFRGRLLFEGLLRLRDRYGAPSYGELLNVLTRGNTADARINDSLVRAFQLFWRGEYDEAAHLAVPKIEASARSLLLELDVGLYNLHAVETPGGYPTLRALLSELEELGLDPSWTYFTRWLLTGPFGANLRNEIAHGFGRPVGPIYSALILRAAVLFSTLTAPARDDVEDAQLDSSPSDYAPRHRQDLVTLLTTPTPVGTPFPPFTVGRLIKAPVVARALRAIGRSVVSYSRFFD